MRNYKRKIWNGSTPLDVTDRITKLMKDNEEVSDSSARNVA
jgi:hypothetical protein